MGWCKNYPQAFLTFAKALAAMVFGLSIATFDEWEMIKPYFGEYSILYKIFYMLMVVQTNIWIYMAGLTLGQSSLDACGFGYKIESKQEGKVTHKTEVYNGVKTIHMKGFIMSNNVTELSQHWNVQIHYWLKYYVMLRVMDRSKPKGTYQPFATGFAFAISSIWHGTYPGFFLLFIACIIIE